MYHHKETATCSEHAYMSRRFPAWWTEEKEHTTNNILDTLIETYATLYGKKEPVGMDTVVHKNGGWKVPQRNIQRPIDEQGLLCNRIGKDKQETG